MGILEWNKKYSVDVQEIDDQHMKLISLLNHLVMKIEQNAYSDVQGVLEELTDYTVTHFSNEEKYMKEFGYSKMASHVEQHSFFIEKLNELKEAGGSDSSMTIEITDFLFEWLINHIQKIDIELAPFLKENGVH